MFILKILTIQIQFVIGILTIYPHYSVFVSFNVCYNIKLNKKNGAKRVIKLLLNIGWCGETNL